MAKFLLSNGKKQMVGGRFVLLDEADTAPCCDCGATLACCNQWEFELTDCDDVASVPTYSLDHLVEVDANFTASSSWRIGTPVLNTASATLAYSHNETRTEQFVDFGSTNVSCEDRPASICRLSDQLYSSIVDISMFQNHGGTVGTPTCDDTFQESVQQTSFGGIANTFTTQGPGGLIAQVTPTDGFSGLIGCPGRAFVTPRQATVAVGTGDNDRDVRITWINNRRHSFVIEEETQSQEASAHFVWDDQCCKYPSIVTLEYTGANNPAGGTDFSRYRALRFIYTKTPDASNAYTLADVSGNDIDLTNPSVVENFSLNILYSTVPTAVGTLGSHDFDMAISFGATVSNGTGDMVDVTTAGMISYKHGRKKPSSQQYQYVTPKCQSTIDAIVGACTGLITPTEFIVPTTCPAPNEWSLVRIDGIAVGVSPFPPLVQNVKYNRTILEAPTDSGGMGFSGCNDLDIVETVNTDALSFHQEWRLLQSEGAPQCISYRTPNTIGFNALKTARTYTSCSVFTEQNSLFAFNSRFMLGANNTASDQVYFAGILQNTLLQPAYVIKPGELVFSWRLGQNTDNLGTNEIRPIVIVRLEGSRWVAEITTYDKWLFDNHSTNPNQQYSSVTLDAPLRNLTLFEQSSTDPLTPWFDITNALRGIRLTITETKRFAGQAREISTNGVLWNMFGDDIADPLAQNLPNNWYAANSSSIATVLGGCIDPIILTGPPQAPPQLPPDIPPPPPPGGGTSGFLPCANCGGAKVPEQGAMV